MHHSHIRLCLVSRNRIPTGIHGKDIIKESLQQSLTIMSSKGLDREGLLYRVQYLKYLIN